MMAGPAMIGNKLDTTCSTGWAYLAPIDTAVKEHLACILGRNAWPGLTRFEAMMDFVNQAVEWLLVDRVMTGVEAHFKN